jgi:hypothetical protein
MFYYTFLKLESRKCLKSKRSNISFPHKIKGNNPWRTYLQDCVRVTNEILYILYGLVFDRSPIDLQDSIPNV